MTTEDTKMLTNEIEDDLFSRYGPLLSDDALRMALGYRSIDAFRQALVRKTVPVPVFSLENRRGKFALVKDVANWLAVQRQMAVAANNSNVDNEAN